jgi:hypothetical protein
MAIVEMSGTLAGEADQDADSMYIESVTMGAGSTAVLNAGARLPGSLALSGDSTSVTAPNVVYSGSPLALKGESDTVSDSTARYSGGPLNLLGASALEQELQLMLGTDVPMVGGSDLESEVIADFKVALAMQGSAAMSGNVMGAVTMTSVFAGSSELELLGEADLFAVVTSSGNSALTVDVTKVEIKNTSRGPQIRPVFVPPPVIPTIRVVPAAAPPPSYQIPTRPRRREDR